MSEENKSDVIFFPKESTYKIGKITYTVTSHYDENAGSLPEKIKKLLKEEIQNEVYKNM